MFTTAWTASPQLPSTGFTPNWSQEGFWRQSLRQVVRVGAGGDRVRIRLSNAYGTSPLRVAGATVARTARGAAVRPDSVRRLTFAGSASAEVPARGEIIGDAAELALESGESVTVTLHLDAVTGPATFHAQAFAASYRGAGDLLADTGGEAFDEVSESWYFLSGVDVSAGRTDAVALFGDSITDGFGSTPGANRRWSDALAERTGRPVLNAGIGGTCCSTTRPGTGRRASGGWSGTCSRSRASTRSSFCWGSTTSGSARPTSSRRIGPRLGSR